MANIMDWYIFVHIWNIIINCFWSHAMVVNTHTCPFSNSLTTYKYNWAILKEGVIIMNLQFVHSAFECLLRCSRFICLQRQRQSFPTAATCLSASAQRASLSLCLSASGPAKVRGNAASPLSPSCLSSNCTLLLHMQQVYAPIFQHMLKMKTHCTCNCQG